MKSKIAILGVLMLTFLAMTGMSRPAAGPGCDCNAHGSTNSQIVR
jgi:hypothetical protein